MRTTPEFSIPDTDAVAQALDAEPLAARQALDEFRDQKEEYYRQTTLAQHNPARANNLVVFALKRVCLAPLLYAAEVELATQVKAMRQTGETFAPPEDTSQLDALFNTYGKYHGNDLAFLRTLGGLAHAATTKFLQAARSDPGHRLRPVLQAYDDIHEEYRPIARQVKVFTVDPSPDKYISELTVVTNTTVQKLLIPAGRHAWLWPSDATTVPDRLLERIDELGRPQLLKAHSNDRYFPDESTGQSAKKCPFAHNTEDIANRGIWGISSLQKGQWLSKHLCPANIPFPSHTDPTTTTTTATLRLVTGIHVATDTLWA